MRQTNLSRLSDLLRARRVDAALFSSPWTLAWLTGYAPPIQTGPNPFDGGPALAWWDGDGLTLICQDAEAGAARAVGAEVVEYAGYTIDAPLDVVARQGAALRAVLGPARGRAASIAVEHRFLTAPLLAVLSDALPGATFAPVDQDLELLRAVKTPEEVAKVRAALAVCDRSQAVVKSLLRPGLREIELWGQMKAQLEAEAGARLPILADLVAGPRTGDIGGLPGEYALAERDPVIADIVPRVDGYWGDICGTHFVGEPSAPMARAWRDARDALRRGIDAVRPGLAAKDLDALMRGAIVAMGHDVYPHHSGHGLGVSWHEEPRIVPYNESTLEPGMIIALEPGVYVSGVGGVRLEDVVLVTDDGCELLTRHLEQA
jgi:Xaa-Pro aminopeptidase